MNIEVASKLGKAVDHVTERLSAADKALDAYIVAIGALFSAGGEAAAISGKPSCVLSPQAQADVAAAVSIASLAQLTHLKIHRALHADGDRLTALDPAAPGDPVPQSGGGGGKLPPTP